MEFKEVLREFTVVNNLTQKDIAKRVGVSQQAVNRVLNSEFDPRRQTIVKYLEKLNGFKDFYHRHKLEEQPTPEISTFKGVPYYDVDFIGGFDLVMNSNTVNPSFFINFQPFNDADYWVNVTGKSMSPFISHGDIIALKRVESWDDFLLFGEIYAIVTPEFRTVKIIAKGERKDTFTLVPYSKDPVFSSQQIPKRLISHVFKVKGAMKKFF